MTLIGQRHVENSSGQLGHIGNSTLGGGNSALGRCGNSNFMTLIGQRHVENSSGQLELKLCGNSALGPCVEIQHLVVVWIPGYPDSQDFWMAGG